jgi:uncharacterized repeat protein (TIGR03803 family)
MSAFGRLVLLGAGAWLGAVATALAQPFEVIKAFEYVVSPYAPVVQGPDDAFYGTAEAGGAFRYGAVFRVAFDGSAWRRSVVHNFDGNDGARPWSGLTLGPGGTLYGTTSSGGLTGAGTVFRLVGSGESWTLEVLYNLDATTGGNSIAGLTLGADGSLRAGRQRAAPADRRTAFRLTQTGAAWTPEVLHAFNGTNGANPWGRVVFGADGALYGTTNLGGGSGLGTVYRLASTGGVWAHQILHSFGGSDGERPWAGLTPGTDGALYGTTQNGGTSAYGPVGTVFRVSGSGSSWTHEVIHNFGLLDGAYPAGDLTNVGGVLYGTTIQASPGAGTVFKLTGGGTAWTHEVVHRFDFDPLAGEMALGGFYPVAGVIEGQDGALYGTTQQGGPGIYGTVFRLSGAGHERPAHFGGWRKGVAHRPRRQGRRRALRGRPVAAGPVGAERAGAAYSGCRGPEALGSRGPVRLRAGVRGGGVLSPSSLTVGRRRRSTDTLRWRAGGSAARSSAWSKARGCGATRPHTRWMS